MSAIKTVFRIEIELLILMEISTGIRFVRKKSSYQNNCQGLRASDINHEVCTKSAGDLQSSEEGEGEDFKKEKREKMKRRRQDQYITDKTRWRPFFGLF